MRAAAGALVVFALLTALVHRDLVGHLDRAIYAPPAAVGSGPALGDFARGDQLLHVWALATNLRHLRGDPARLFEANSFYPQTRGLFFSDHLFGEALAVWPLTLVTTNPVLLHNLALLMSFVLAGTGLTLLVRALTGSMAAGLVAGVVWAFSPARNFEIFQLQLLFAQWIPFLFLCVHRTLVRPRLAPALGAGALLAWQLLSGIYVGTYLVLCLVPCVVLLWAAAPPGARRPAAWRLGPALAAGALLTVPWFLEYLWVRDALGESGGLLENVAFSLAVQHYLIPNWATGATRFPGPLTVTLGVLAVAGVVARSGPAARARWPYAATALWAIALSLGPYVRFGAGPATASGPEFLGRGPYAVLWALVPGLDALRVPARMSLLAAFFLAVLAGFGAAALLGRIGRPWARAALALALGAAALAEGRPQAPAVERLAVGDGVPPVYAWLRDRTGTDDAVLELPMNPVRDPLYLYYSTVHWRPLVNGYGAYLSEAYRYMQAETRGFPDAAAVAALRALDVRWVVVHRADATAPDRPLAGVRRAATLGTDAVYEIVAAPPPDEPPRPAMHPLPRAGWHASGGAGAAHAVDGDPRTAWSNVGDLTRDLLGPHGGGLAWLRGLHDWPAYLRAHALSDRPERLTVDLGAVVDPARLDVLLRIHQSPVFAPVALDVSRDGERWTRVDCRWRPAAPLRDFALRPAESPLTLPCALPALRYLRFEQTPRALRVYWEIADVRVFVADREVVK